MIDEKRLAELLRETREEPSVTDWRHAFLRLANRLDAPHPEPSMPGGTEIRFDGLWVRLSDGCSHKVLFGDEKAVDVELMAVAMTAYAACLRQKENNS